jgi:eukaryotic-like serine/threonine-protein kinase
VSESLPFALAAAATRVGSTHRENQDCFQVLDGKSNRAVRELRRGILYAVADGVSTLEQGRWAAETTCARLSQFFEEAHVAQLETLVQLVGEIDWELRGQGKGRAACTLGAIWLHRGHAHVLHVGDSPVYRLRKGELQCMTTMDRASRRLRSFMGMGPSISEVLAVRTEAFEPRDVYFLVTDGVSGLLDPALLSQHWADSNGNPERCAEGIMREIDARSGADDATAVVVQILLEEDLPEERTEEIPLEQFAGAERDTENLPGEEEGDELTEE